MTYCRLFNTKSCSRIYIKYKGFGWVFWYINHSGLLNSKSCLFTYINSILFVWVGFYGISTIVCYSIPYAVYTYLLNINDLVWLDFMVYQPLWIMQCPTLFIYVY